MPETAPKTASKTASPRAPRPARQTRNQAAPRPHDALSTFHPAVAGWFSERFESPTAVQARVWAAARAGRHALVSAPTGSGKTLAAFLGAIDELARAAESGTLADAVHTLYVSPLKALSNDIQRNLEAPLAGVQQRLLQAGSDATPLRALVRTGDTPASARERMKRRPPHILVTTPESLYLLLSSDSGRRMLAGVRTLILDEIHALAGTKRGDHLSLSVARLAALVGEPMRRVGMSATLSPLPLLAEYLAGDEPVDIVDSGHCRPMDLQLALPSAPLGALMSNAVAAQLYDQIAELARQRRTTLVFVNTRRQAERVARQLAERLGADCVAAHHGSLAKESRLDTEERLRAGALRVVVATAALEMGIDIGDVELVCQLGTPRAINTLLQRVGRSGRTVNSVATGRLFPLSRDDLLECTALLGAIADGQLDLLRLAPGALDALAQQIVAEVSARDWRADALYAMFRSARPYRSLARRDFDALVSMLASGYATARGRAGAYLHHDAANGMLRARRGARITALIAGGMIPDQFDCSVVLEPGDDVIGSVNEDFAIESLAGDVFQLGNHSYRILGLSSGRLRVADAAGQAPNIPFWLGEAPGRSEALSAAVSALREGFGAAYCAMREAGCEAEAAAAAMADWLRERYPLSAAAAAQLAAYLSVAAEALDGLPHAKRLVFERFFDEAQNMHLVIHAPLGMRINRAWGLALRKRFCRQFNFELQAAALDDCIVISFGATHSFGVTEPAGYLSADSAPDVLSQAVLDTPLFGTRWRWVASAALAVRRRSVAGRTPPPIQRAQAEDLLSLVFPDQLACNENLSGARRIPDHPLVAQTMYDCLHEAMDLDGLVALLARMRDGEVRVVGRELSAPSPLAEEVLLARPYAFLDDAPAEERRTLAVRSQPGMHLDEASRLARLEPDAVDAALGERALRVRDVDELHDALVVMGLVSEDEARGMVDGPDGADGAERMLDVLAARGSATRLSRPGARTLWVAAERLADTRTALGGTPTPAIAPAPELAADTLGGDPETALRILLGARLEFCGPITGAALAAALDLNADALAAAIAALVADGAVLAVRMPGDGAVGWCDKRLLSRIQRIGLLHRRERVRPVSIAAYQRFLLRWQGLGLEEPPSGEAALARAISALDGYEANAASWEASLLPGRVADYDPAWLDALCLRGALRWRRLSPPPSGRGSALRSVAVALITRERAALWERLAPRPDPSHLSGVAQRLAEALSSGPRFADELADGLLDSHLEDGLRELVAAGLAHSDSFAGLRYLMRRRRAGRRAGGLDSLPGRWVATRIEAERPAPDDADLMALARVLLRRYGVLFRRLLDAEASWLPPWRTLLAVCRRLEAQGELRGGRFVEGVFGEQFALPEAIEPLARESRRSGPARAAPDADGPAIVVSACDPVNLSGVLSEGLRVPAQAANRLLYRDGVASAALSGKAVIALPSGEPDFAVRSEDRQALRARGGERMPSRPARPVRMYW